MIHPQDERRKRRTRPCVEPLDDRVVLSGVSALGIHAAAAAVAEAAHPRDQVVARFDATVSRFEDRAATQFDRASRRIDHVETIDQGAVDRSDMGTIPGARTAAVQGTRSTSTIASDFHQFVTNSDRWWNQAARTLDNQFDQAMRRDTRSDPALEPTALADEANLAATNAALGSRLADELVAANNQLQVAITSTQSTAANVRARPATATAAAQPVIGLSAARGLVHHAPAIEHQPSGRAAATSAATGTATASPVLATGVTTATQFGTAGSPNNGAGLGPVPATVGTLATGGVPGSAGNGSFGVGTFGGTGDLVGGTPPSPVTGTTGAGVDTGLDTFGIGTGLGVGSGIGMTPNGDGLLF